MNVMTPQISQGLDQPITTALRALAMDAVENAKSGHPGAQMGMFAIAGNCLISAGS
jgi:transketolase